MKTKDETPTKVKQYLALIEHQNSFIPKAICTDNRHEYINKDLHTYCLYHGIEIQMTMPYTPEQNGITKCWNKTVVKLAHLMIFICNISDKLMALGYEPCHLHPKVCLFVYHAWQDAIYVHKKWSGKHSDIPFIQEFGHSVWILNQEQNPSKLDECVKVHMYLYSEWRGPRAIKYYDAVKKTVKVSQEAYVYELTSHQALVWGWGR